MPLTPMPPPVDIVLLSMPSSSTSLFCQRPPPPMKGRFEATPLTGAVKPVSKPNANGLRPFNGRSMIFLLSITCPNDDVALSSNGAAAVTSTDCSSVPACKTAGRFTVWSTARVMPVKVRP